MGFGTKQLKVLDWMQKLGGRRYPGIKSVYNPYDKFIFVRFGRFYATNGYILASVEWPEYEHAADEGWCVVDDYKDGKGFLLSTITFDNPMVCDKMRDRIFEDCFVRQGDVHECGPYNPRLIAECMKPFIASDITVSPVIGADKIEFTGRGKDVSIRVVMMGMR